MRSPRTAARGRAGEARRGLESRLIALPVTRILARSSHPLAPIFYLNGGPGITNMTFPQAGRLAAQHDVVMVGYRGVDGSSVLNCPEVTAALDTSGDYLGKASLTAYSRCLPLRPRSSFERSGVDLAGYTMEEQAADIEATASRSATSTSTCSARAPGPVSG